MHKINFSGHPVQGYEVAPLVGVNLPVDLGEALTEALSRVLDSLPMAAELRHGAAAEVILPGMANATGVFLALWHGRFGSFPSIRWAVRGADGFGWPDSARVNLQELRLQARTAR